MQEGFIFFPERFSEGVPLRFPWPFEEMRVRSGEALLHALYFPVSKPKGCILYFHGNAGSLRTWGFIAEDFVTRGYDIAILDYRGYGKSEGEILNEQMLHTDAENFYARVMERCPGGRIIIYGRSIGTGIASALAVRHPPDLLILEAPPTSVPDLAAVHYPFVPRLMVRYRLDVLDDVRNITGPIVILHGTQDGIIPHSMSKKLAAAARGDCRLFLIEGGGHNDLATFPEYQKILDSVLQ
jgi:hypothetical protein